MVGPDQVRLATLVTGLLPVFTRLAVVLTVLAHRPITRPRQFRRLAKHAISGEAADILPASYRSREQTPA
jgi:hypothetical protein